MAFRGFIRDVLVLFLSYFVFKSLILKEGITLSIIITLILLLGLTLLFMVERILK